MFLEKNARDFHENNKFIISYLKKGRILKFINVMFIFMEVFCIFSQNMKYYIILFFSYSCILINIKSCFFYVSIYLKSSFSMGDSKFQLCSYNDICKIALNFKKRNRKWNDLFKIQQYRKKEEILLILICIHLFIECAESYNALMKYSYKLMVDFTIR